MKRLLMLCLLPLFIGAGSPNEETGSVKFFKGTLTSAFDQAKKEGKLVFVDFYANWCSPCRLMDEYTFTDPELAKYMSDKYIPVKVNIDDFDGFAYKQQYNINLLPTLIVMNCDGKEIERKEEGLVPSTLSAFLDKNFKPSNICDKPIEVPRPVVSTPRPVVTAPQPPKPSISDKPKPPAVSKPEKPVVTSPSKPAKPTRPVVSSPKPTVAPPKANPTLEDGLFRFSVQKQPSKGFSVQTGAFGEYGNVLREVDKLQKLFPNKPIIVYISKKDGRTIYKILVGEFNSRSEAYSYKEFMKNKGSAGLIKNLEFMN